MSKHDHDAHESHDAPAPVSKGASTPAAKDAPLTEARVQQLIHAALVRHDVTHGHLSADDAAAALAALDGQ